MTCAPPATLRRGATGRSLPEVLVAVTLGLVILAGALSGLQAVWKSHRSAAAQFQLHERALHVLGLLEPGIQMAGYFGLASLPPLPLVDSGTVRHIACGAGAIPALGEPIEIFDAAPLQDCFVQAGGPLPGSRLLLLRRVSTRLALPEAGRLQLLTQSAPLPLAWLSARGDLAPVPGLPHQELHDLIVQIYYIARRADGGDRTPALRVKTLTRIGSTPAFIDTEVMPGISELQVTPLQTANGRPGAILLEFAALADVPARQQAETANRLNITRTIALCNPVMCRAGCAARLHIAGGAGADRH